MLQKLNVQLAKRRVDFLPRGGTVQGGFSLQRRSFKVPDLWIRGLGYKRWRVHSLLGTSDGGYRLRQWEIQHV